MFDFLKSKPNSALEEQRRGWAQLVDALPQFKQALQLDNRKPIKLTHAERELIYQLLEAGVKSSQVLVNSIQPKKGD